MASHKFKAGKINFQCQVGKTKTIGFLLALTGVDSNFCCVSLLPKEALIAWFRGILLVIAKKNTVILILVHSYLVATSDKDCIIEDRSY